MATLLEGAESITLWCSFAVLAPAVVLIVTARAGQAWLVVGTIVGTATMMWARAGRLWDWEVDGALRWFVGAAILTTLGVVFRTRRWAAPMGLGLGAISGAIAGWLWQPCVGEHFAEVLNQAENDRITSLIRMHAYVVGLSVPVILIAAVRYAWPAAQGMIGRRGVRRGGLTLAVAYGLAVAAGWYDDLVSELFRLSST